ncbi:hypothetical protein GCM10009838_48860 [Catenulispora subtropica]|uniref:Uncharacterized protein n=1 Tax=Catenulispora subtropica TaxID=450798 RepID=A0ABN2S828_9ACTN
MREGGPPHRVQTVERIVYAHGLSAWHGSPTAASGTDAITLTGPHAAGAVRSEPRRGLTAAPATILVATTALGAAAHIVRTRLGTRLHIAQALTTTEMFPRVALE